MLDFAELKRSSISFFDIEKPETAVSRWARARTRAAKVNAILVLCELYFFDRYCSMMVLNLSVLIFCRWERVCLRIKRLVNLLCSIGLRQ